MYFDLETKDSSFIYKEETGLSPTPHLHTHLELIYFISGSSRCYADEREVCADAGDLFLAFPNQIHYYHDIIRPQHHIMIFSADLCPDFAELLRTTIPLHPLIGKSDLPPRAYELIKTLCTEHGKDCIYAEAACKARLTLLLCELLPIMKPQKTHTRYDGNLLKKAVAYCYDNYCGEISLESAENALGISRYYISHLFREKLHIGFKEYINSLRIQNACEMLRGAEKSITEIAYDAGFGTTRTFNRCFLEAKGITPKEYRLRHAASSRRSE